MPYSSRISICQAAALTAAIVLAACGDNSAAPEDDAANNAAMQEAVQNQPLDPAPQEGSPAVAADGELSASSFRLILPAISGRPGVLYGTITGGAQGDRLTGIALAGPASAARVELHETQMGEGGAMSMEERSALDIPAGESAMLEQGGWHGMVFELPPGIEAGTTLPVTLTFADAGQRTVDAKVEARGSGQ